MQRSISLRRHETTFIYVLRLSDVALCIIAGALAYAAVFGLRRPPNEYQLAIFLQALLVLGLFPSLNVYRSYRAHRFLAPAGRAIVAWLVSSLVLLALLLLAGPAGTFSRTWLLCWIGIGAFSFALLRMAAYGALRQLRRSGHNLKRVALIGDGYLSKQLVDRVAQEAWMGFGLAMRYPNPKGGAEPQARMLAQFSRDLVRKKIDEVWIVMPLEQGDFVKRLYALVQEHAVTVRYAPDLGGMFLLNHGVTELAGIPMIDLTASPHEGLHGLLKSVEDWLLASVALIIALPLMALIAVVVRLSSSGPVLFKQRRHGWGGEEITIYKFRTMAVHRDGGAVVQAKREDPRVTPVGRFLRRTSLDELPQLVNVLQGRMSLVGPRPHACEHNDMYCRQIDGYMMRHKVRPGITGWAQVNGLRGETDTLEKMKLRVKYDLYYIEHWSLWLDVKILLLTLVRGFAHPNAY